MILRRTEYNKLTALSIFLNLEQSEKQPQTIEIKPKSPHASFDDNRQHEKSHSVNIRSRYRLIVNKYFFRALRTEIHYFVKAIEVGRDIVYRIKQIWTNSI